MSKQGFVYIISNFRRTVLYTGVTSCFERRMYQHKHKLLNGFSKQYCCTDLLWWEHSESIVAAIAREKQIKSWSRARKNELVTSFNPKMRDLSKDLFNWE